MRLIDVDKLPATCNVAIVNGKLELDGWIAAKRLTEAPTVEAIPVDWIKDYIDFGVSDKLAQHDMRFVSKMIEDWEKEKNK